MMYHNPHLPFEPDASEDIACLPGPMQKRIMGIMQADVEVRALLSCKSAWRIVHGLYSIERLLEFDDISSLNNHPSIEGFEPVEYELPGDVVSFDRYFPQILTHMPVHYGIMLEDDKVWSIINSAGPAWVRSVHDLALMYSADSYVFFRRLKPEVVKY